MLPATHLDGQDVSIGWLVEERFGREVVDRLVEPLLGGVYAGHAREISARAAVPQVVALLDRDRSMMRAAAAGPASRPSDVPVFAGLVGGIGRLPARRRGLGGPATCAPARRSATWPVRRRAVGTWSSAPTRDAEVLHADAVVLATPARRAGRLLADVVPDAALELARIEYASMADRHPGLPRPRLARRPQGSGFLVPPVDGRVGQGGDVLLRQVGLGPRRRRGRRTACSCCAARSAGTARSRCCSARTTRSSQLALEDLADAIGLSVRPVDAHVQRWGGALPQYAVGHLDRVRNIRAAVAAAGGLAVCGAAYDGLGIPACIASAEVGRDPGPAPPCRTAGE